MKKEELIKRIPEVSKEEIMKASKKARNLSLWIDNSTGDVYEKINDKWKITDKSFKSNKECLWMHTKPTNY